MDRYTLKYNWSWLKGSGNVLVKRQEATEIHYLSVNGNTIGHYVKNTEGGTDEGVTYRGPGTTVKIGKGNLLAGILFRFLLEKRIKE